MIATGTATKRNQRRPPALQEHQHDDRHQDDGREQRPHDFVDRFADERRRVEAQCRSANLRESSWPVRPSCRARARPCPGHWHTAIGTRRCSRRDDRRARSRRPVLRAELDAANVLDPDDPALGRPLDDDIFELLRIDQPAQRAERDLRQLALADRLLADLPAGHLRILLAHGVGHVAGIQVHPGQPVGIDPNAHAVVLRCRRGSRRRRRRCAPTRPSNGSTP